MSARGPLSIPCGILIVIMVLMASGMADAWDQHYRYPVKIRVSGAESYRGRGDGFGSASACDSSGWDVAAGQSRREILCPRRGYSIALGMRPFFTTLTGSTKVVNKSGEGTYMNLVGHLRLPSEVTMWEFYSNLRLWDRITLRLEYAPWAWAAAGHVPSDGDFAGLLLKKDDSIHTDLNITSLSIGSDYDVSFGRELTFGPNADLHVIKWTQRVQKSAGDAMDFGQTIIQPAIGAHGRYEPLNTGYFSWFKPFAEARFTWMSFAGLGLATWDFGAGIAPPVSRNVDAGVKLGYKQWKLDGSRGRLFTDVAVEGPYMDFSFQF